MDFPVFAAYSSLSNAMNFKVPVKYKFSCLSEVSSTFTAWSKSISNPRYLPPTKAKVMLPSEISPWNTFFSTNKRWYAMMLSLIPSRYSSIILLLFSLQPHGVTISLISSRSLMRGDIVGCFSPSPVVIGSRPLIS